MMQKKKIKSGRVRRKVNIFIVFLICSFLAWLVSRLSEIYTQGTSFDLVYTNAPDSLELINASKYKVDVRLRASGFQFLGFNFKKKKIPIDLSTVDQKESIFYIPQKNYRKQIQNQLTGSMTLLEVDRDTLFFKFYKIYKKEVPVRSNVTVILGQNYLLDGALEIAPETIWVKGPKEEVDGVEYISTLKMELSEQTSDFNSRVALSLPKGIENSTLSVNSVKVSGKVFRFSEKIVDIPIEVINLPEGTAIRTFPEKLSVLCKARIGKLKDLSAAEFELVADYSKVKSNTKKLSVKLVQSPENLHTVQLLENEVEFILKRE